MVRGELIDKFELGLRREIFIAEESIDEKHLYELELISIYEKLNQLFENDLISDYNIYVEKKKDRRINIIVEVELEDGKKHIFNSYNKDSKSYTRWTTFIKVYDFVKRNIRIEKRDLIPLVF